MFDLKPWKKAGPGEVTHFRRELDNLFDRFFRMDFPLSTDIFSEGHWNPRVDIVERENEITVKAEIPGVEAKDIDLKLEGRTLTIKGEKKQETEGIEGSYHRVERSYGFFNRVLELPDEVDPESVEAGFKKGVLTVVMKKTKTSRSRKIEIN
jgi:HSP20 family protein